MEYRQYHNLTETYLNQVNEDTKQNLDEVALPVNLALLAARAAQMSPKLSKGPDQFLEIVKKMYEEKPNLEVVLAGHRRQYIIQELKKNGIPFHYYEMTDIEKLNELYNVLDLYIVASRVEGGPAAIFECALTKTPICDFGKKAENFKLKSTNGEIISLHDIKGTNGTLIMFICNHCPYVKAVVADIVEDCVSLEKEGIKSIAIMSNDTNNYHEDSF